MNRNLYKKFQLLSLLTCVNHTWECACAKGKSSGPEVAMSSATIFIAIFTVISENRTISLMSAEGFTEQGIERYYYFPNRTLYTSSELKHIPKLANPLLTGHYAITGSLEPETLDGFVDMHVHLGGDVSNPPSLTMVHAAAKGATGLVIVDHDSTMGFERYRQMNEQRGLDLDLFPGVESTAVMQNSSGSVIPDKHKHVLALFEPDTFERGELPQIPCYMPIPKLNAFVHDLGGMTSVAHPSMGDFSVTIREVLEIQNRSNPREHFDFVEGMSGGVLELMSFVSKYPKLAEFARRRGILPHSNDTNHQTLLAYSNGELGEAVKGMTAGSDAHAARYAGMVGIMYDRSAGLFKSIVSGNYVIARKLHHLNPVHVKGLVLGTLRSKQMQRRRNNGWHGFEYYKHDTGAGTLEIAEAG